jgi:PmbA protein
LRSFADRERSSHDAAATNVFTHDSAELNGIATHLVNAALRRGASDAVARASESDQLAVTVRNARAESLQHSRTQGVTLTVYHGQRSGTASSSDLSPAALAATVESAWHIAQYSGVDPCAGPADAGMLESAPQNLDLFHPWDVSADTAIELAQRAESAARHFDKTIVNSRGASVSAHHGQFALATSQGFLGGYADSFHSLNCSVIAGNENGMQTGHWGTVRRVSTELDSPEATGRRAAEQASLMLDARRLPTGTWPVLFDARIAAPLVRTLVAAVSGEALYRKQGFLPGSLGQRVLADHLSLLESAHELCGLASAPFDHDGVRTGTRDVVRDGVLQGYFLSTYAGRKLGMTSTGFAGGPHNLCLRSSRTEPTDDLHAMLRRLDRGLFVTHLLGQGVNLLTGDYSRGAAGFWVENGVIQYPVQEITIAGNLKDMLRHIVALGADVHLAGLRTGSILIEAMRVAGI